ncbi:MAG: TatD family hydrolase [Bacteroidetes bacterium]|jgi:TatD DNase family protein|nr:TatD family hydrolase [Bacteroidota bacterium]
MGLNYIDTHSHLYADDFKEDMEEVIGRVEQQGVFKVLLPNIEMGSFNAMMNLTSSRGDIFMPMIGLHPCSVKEATYQRELDFVEDQLKKHQFVGIGEIGMDLYWDKTTYEIQKEALEIQCKWAIEHNLPVALHTRDATKEVIDIVAAFQDKKLTGVFHCFGDGIAEADRIIELGFKLGIGGVLTFKNSGLDKVMKDVDLEHIVLETDAPYLAPAPYRGKRNESSYIPLIAQKLADVKEVSLAEVAEITTQNANELFSI